MARRPDITSGDKEYTPMAVMAWFASASLLVFAPLLAMGVGILRAEAGPLTPARLWLRRPSAGDWRLVARG